MQILKNWIIKHFSNILGIISLLATVFFGYFFVPIAFTEYKEYKKNNAANQVIQTTKEYLFSDSISNYKEIKLLIESKQASLNEKLNRSPKWYLQNVSNSFNEDKFLSLPKRRELNSEISKIMKEIPEEDRVQEDISESNNSMIWLISFIITTIVLVLGVYSFIRKLTNRKNVEEELKNELEQVNTEKGSNDKQSKYIFLKENILSVLNRLNYKKYNLGYIGDKGNRYDIRFTHNKRNYFIETKYLEKSKVGLKTINNFLTKAELYQGVGIFVHNTEMTALSKSRLKDFNKLRSDLKIYNIPFVNEELLTEQIRQIVENTA